MQPLMTSEPTSVGDYRLVGRLGRGAMGAVYLGRSRGGRMVAVKLVRADLAGDTEFRERFRREVQMARSVGGFWTAAVVDADPDAEQPWLATEYVPGPTLDKAISDHGPLPEHSARSLAAGLAEALGAIHRAGLVHRDLKPANVLLGPDGPRVIDFGISRAMAAKSLTATGMFMGTPGFFSPEQAAGDDVGPPSDVFSLGAVLVFATTGTGPFDHDNTPAMLYRVVHAAPDLAGVPDELRPLLAACLRKDPAQRPTTTQILDEVGEPSPDRQWLPPAIKAAVDEHTERLQRSALAPPERPPAPPPSARSYAAARPATLAYAPPQPIAATERTDKIMPAQPKITSPQAASVVGKDTPGPVFATGGRISALLWAIVMLAVVSFLFGLGSHPDPRLVPVLLPLWPVLQIIAVLAEISAVLSLIKMVLPGLRLKINAAGLRIARFGLAREIPWQQVSRVGIVGRGGKQAVVVWVADSAPQPPTLWWHWVRRYHGGYRIFPIGAVGGWRKRRREINRVRLALQQYAPAVYDSRLL